MELTMRLLLVLVTLSAALIAVFGETVRPGPGRLFARLNPLGYGTLLLVCLAVPLSLYAEVQSHRASQESEQQRLAIQEEQRIWQHRQYIAAYIDYWVDRNKLDLKLIGDVSAGGSLQYVVDAGYPRRELHADALEQMAGDHAKPYMPPALKETAKRLDVLMRDRVEPLRIGNASDPLALYPGGTNQPSVLDKYFDLVREREEAERRAIQEKSEAEAGTP